MLLCNKEYASLSVFLTAAACPVIGRIKMFLRVSYLFPFYLLLSQRARNINKMLCLLDGKWSAYPPTYSPTHAPTQTQLHTFCMPHTIESVVSRIPSPDLEPSLRIELSGSTWTWNWPRIESGSSTWTWAQP
jgi:hypothetical protein